MFIIYRTKDKKDTIVAECQTKEEAKKVGQDTFVKAEKGETVTMISPVGEGISFTDSGQIIGKYKLYEFWN